MTPPIPRAVEILLQHRLPEASPAQLDSFRRDGLLEAVLYPASVMRAGDDLLAMVREDGEKNLLLLSRHPTPGRSFQGRAFSYGDWNARFCPLTTENAAALRQALPWTAPVSLSDRPTTFWCGDRLGRASPGHVRAARRFRVAPVLAQQSMRELTLTHRTFQQVLDDVSFLVFQSGYTAGFGADADHLKTLDHIAAAVDVGMTMITLDLSEVMRPEVAQYTPERVQREFEGLPAYMRAVVRRDYAGRTFSLRGPTGQATIRLEEAEALRCAVMYGPALDFAGRVYELLCRKRGAGNFDLEMSIDETTTPTLPCHHLFLARELLRRGIRVVSLAPRFVGEFQKGIDYIGDLTEFTRQFTEHAVIAQAHGNYKISIHSGSDKFSIFPVIGRLTAGRFHEKTAGTSWLEAVRLVSVHAPRLYRKLHKIALDRLPDAQKLYHITPDLFRIPSLMMLRDEDLAGLLDLDPARQVLHVAYGFILEDPTVRYEFFQVLDQYESEHYEMLDRHFTRHMEGLQIPPV